jgi:protein TonB
MTIAFLILATAQGVAISNSPPPPSVPPVHVTLLPPAPPMPPQVVLDPKERQPLQSLFSPYDYPQAAEGSGVRGIVAVTLTIGPDGRIRSCAIRQSSGVPLLDEQTCNTLRRRARFTPAMDSNGNPATGTVDREVDWGQVFNAFRQTPLN